MKKKQKVVKKLQLFNPDKISTDIHLALQQDFREAQHEYCLDDRVTLYAFNRQVHDFKKKYVSPTCTDSELDAKTYEKFHTINAHMKRFNGDFELPLTSQHNPDSACTPMDKIHIRARAIMRMVLGNFEYDELFEECKNSAGSTIGVPFTDTSPEKKFTYPISVTEDAKPYLLEALNHDKELMAGIINYNTFTPIGDAFRIVNGSCATTVPKSHEIKRFITVGATGNMYIQQGLMAMMYKRMKLFGLDLEVLPDAHRQLARESSITGRNATIDWSSASDCMHPELLKWLLPRQWFEVCDDVREKETMINGVPVKLNMFSTMGNATTFPLETLVFWTYAHACRLTLMHPNKSVVFPEWKDWQAVSVFGDDCIVPTSMAEFYITAMEKVGFIVNKEKSYYGSELFRESCGGDYLAGYDVRPFMLKAPHSTKKSALEPWLYIVTNGLLKKYVSYFGTTSYVYDKHLFRLIFALFRKNKINIKLVPSFYPDDAGLKLSHDIERFTRHYRIKLNTIKRSKHGTVSFNFLRFVYEKKACRFDGIRLALWLKNPRLEDVVIGKVSPVPSILPKHHVSRPIRVIGGYVVAKGLSCHWHVPTVKSASS